MPDKSPSNLDGAWISPGMAAFAVVIIAIALALGTLSPKLDAANDVLLFPYADKFLHFLGWFVLGLAAASISPTADWQVLAWSACAAFGLLTEIGQIFVVGRYFQLSDCIADMAGAALGIMVIGVDESEQ